MLKLTFTSLLTGFTPWMILFIPHPTIPSVGEHKLLANSWDFDHATNAHFHQSLSCHTLKKTTKTDAQADMNLPCGTWHTSSKCPEIQLDDNSRTFFFFFFCFASLKIFKCACPWNSLMVHFFAFIKFKAVQRNIKIHAFLKKFEFPRLINP